MERITKYLIAIMFICCIPKVNAQVVIGSTKDPEPFTILELVSTTGGLRLPQLDNEKRGLLTELLSNNLAEGLMIYNIESKKIEYWNGDEWLSVLSSANFNTSSDLDVVGGDGATLGDVSAEINDGAVTPAMMAGSTELGVVKVYSTNELGEPKLVNKEEVVNSFNPINGLNGSSQTLELGGDLSKSTSIAMGSNDLEITSEGGNLNINNTLVTDVGNRRMGIGDNSPSSTLHVKGSFATGEEIFDATGLNDVSISNITKIGQATIIGGNNDFLITTDNGVVGQRLIICNNTNYTGTLRPLDPEGETYKINTGQVRQFIFSNGDWHSTVPSTTVKEMYIGEAKIPPHAYASTESLEDWDNHSNPAYDTDDWIIISKESVSGTISGSKAYASHMILVYEYTGKAFDLDNLYPILSATNKNEGSLVALGPIYQKIETVNDKTQITVNVSRIDRMGDRYNWSENLLSLSILLVNSTI